MAKSNCDNCFYCGKLNGGSTRYCRYIFMTDQMRPCPPGDECTVKVGRKVNRRKKKGDANHGNS